MCLLHSKATTTLMLVHFMCIKLSFIMLNQIHSITIFETVRNADYEKLNHWMMQFQHFDWLSRYGI